MAHSLLEACQVSKHFPGVQALAGVSLTVRGGEVVAVIGENGAGKSTLMKVLAGIHKPDAGELRLDGQPFPCKGVADCLKRGIVLIHQELNQADNLSVSANIFLGREKLKLGPLGWLDRSGMARETASLLARVGLDVPPGELVGNLPLGQRQLVEIARALALNARVIIMDEPTSSLTQRETDRLFGVIADLKQAGVAIIYISHRLAEVQRLADRVVVLRDGKNSGELDREQVSHAAMVQLMVGRDLKQFFHRQHEPVASVKPRLEVREVCYTDGPAEPISFMIHPGEIVGMAGLVGAGRTELAEALYGIRSIIRGEVILDGKPVVIRHPGQALQAGLVLAPEDRRRHGLVLDDSVLHNLSLPSLDRLSVLGLIDRGRERELAEASSTQMRIRTPSLAQLVRLLSGGNQQKVVLGKWLALQPCVLILDEPTRGVDVGSKSEIYALMDELARTGVGILMISSDLEEVLGVSDRVLVLHEGQLAGELPGAEVTEEAVMRLATGMTLTPARAVRGAGGN